jgi:hypothetical protein
VCGATGDGSGRALRPFGRSSFAGAGLLMGGTGEAALSPALSPRCSHGIRWGTRHQFREHLCHMDERFKKVSAAYRRLPRVSPSPPSPRPPHSHT